MSTLRAGEAVAPETNFDASQHLTYTYIVVDNWTQALAGEYQTVKDKSLQVRGKDLDW